MADLPTIALLAFSIFVIYKSSEWVIRYSLSLSRLLGISTFVVGFILVSIATSLPEVFVTVFATIAEEAPLAVGNILGSNLFDINIIIGFSTIFIGSIHMKRKETLHLVELLFITSVITLAILSFPTLSRIHGIVLLILFAYMLGKLYKGGKIAREDVPEENIPKLRKKNQFLDFLRKNTIPLTFVKFFISVAILLVGTRLLVDSSLAIAEAYNIAATFIGATIVAAGTSIPELSVTFAAIKKRHYALAMGDLLGSAVTNITLVLGILSLISLSPINVIDFVGILPVLIVSSLVVWYSFNTKRKITKNEGVLLLALYVLFLVQQFGLEVFLP